MKFPGRLPEGITHQARSKKPGRKDGKMRMETWTVVTLRPRVVSRNKDEGPLPLPREKREGLLRERSTGTSSS